MTLNLSTAAIFRTRYLTNRSVDPVETFSVFPIPGEVSLFWSEVDTYRHAYSFCIFFVFSPEIKCIFQSIPRIISFFSANSKWYQYWLIPAYWQIIYRYSHTDKLFTIFFISFWTPFMKRVTLRRYPMCATNLFALLFTNTNHYRADWYWHSPNIS